MMEGHVPSGHDASVTAHVLRTYHSVAVVGLSPDPTRPSHAVARYLQEQGYDVVPVNPNCREVLGRRCYPDLRSVPGGVEIVDVFRRSESVGPIADDAIAIGAKVLWLQDGVVNEEAAERARRAGLIVIMDDCMAREHRRLIASR